MSVSRLFELPPPRITKAALDLIHEVEQGRFGGVPPCVLLAGLRDQLGAGGAQELIVTLMEADAIVVDHRGVRLTPMGERLRLDVRGLFGLADEIEPANDVGAEPVRGNA